MLPLVSMLYVAFSLTSLVLTYFVIDLKFTIITGSALVLPFSYFISDIIAEVYGFYVAKRMIWYLIICWLLFSLITFLIIKFPTPSYWQHREAYDFILGNMLQVTLVTCLSVIIGANINIYIVSKWKLLIKGKYFWMRSVGSSMIGEFSQYAIAVPMLYYNVLSIERIVQLISLDFIVQVSLMLILAGPANFIAYGLKKIEHLDVYDKDITFNPLKLYSKL